MTNGRSKRKGQSQSNRHQARQASDNTKSVRSDQAGAGLVCLLAEGDIINVWVEDSAVLPLNPLARSVPAI